MTFKKAIDALDRDDPQAALAPLISEWKTCRSGALSEVIDAVSLLASKKHGPLEGSNREKRLVAWDAAFKRAAPGATGVLFDALSTFALSDAEPRLKLLEQRMGTDPRRGSWLLTLMRKAPTGWHGNASLLFWRGCLTSIQEHVDARVIAELPKLLAHWKADRSHAIGRWLSEQLPLVITRLSKKWEEPFFDDSSLDGVRSRLTRAPPKDGAGLAAVYADPFDSSVRQVVADALAEQGDPRGEFIALQLAGKLSAAQKKQERALLQTHARAWLGPLDDAIQKSGLRYERGFPVSAKLSVKSEARRNEVIGLPEWATFEELDCESWGGDCGPLVTHPSMRSLKVLHAASPSVFESKRALLLEDVRFRWFTVHDEVKGVFDSKCVPALKHLRVWPYAIRSDAPDSVTWAPYWDTRVMHQLEALTVIQPNETFTEWFGLLTKVPKNITQVNVEASSSEPWALRFTRTPSSWALELRYGWNSAMHEANYTSLGTALSKVRASFEKVTFDFNRAHETPTSATRSQLTTMLKSRLRTETVEFLEPTGRARAGRQ